MGISHKMLFVWMAVLQIVVYGNVLGGKSLEQTISLDINEDYNVTWYTLNEQRIIFTVMVRTTGWIGLGFSPAGGMRGADIIICGVDKAGNGYLEDRFAPEIGYPVLDDSQDVELISASERDGVTTVSFSRSLTNCDQQDLDINEDTTRLIFAWGPTDQVFKHESSKRGQKSLYLMDKLKPDAKSVDDDASEFDLVYEAGYTVKAGDDTVYTFGLVRSPELNNTKHHVISFEGIVTPGNEGIVHHMVVTGCFSDFNATDFSRQFEVYEDYQLMPLEFYSCTHTVFAWAVGGGVFHYPDHTGYPIGDSESPKWFLLNTHYDNPTKQAGKIKDFSGIRIRYTKNLREHDAGVFVVGANTLGFYIPPGQDDFYIRGDCPSVCTRPGIPEDGINVFGYLLHSHLLGRQISLIQRRGNQQSIIAEDKSYDFNFQETRQLPTEAKIKQGDALTVMCKMNSKDRTNLTIGSEATYDEMCIVYLYYYPRINLSICSTTHQWMNGYNPTGYGNSQWPSIELVNKDWTGEAVFEAQKDHIVNDVYPTCISNQGTPIYNNIEITASGFAYNESSRITPYPVATRSCEESCKFHERDCAATIWTASLEYKATSSASFSSINGLLAVFVTAVWTANTCN